MRISEDLEDRSRIRGDRPLDFETLEVESDRTLTFTVTNPANNPALANGLGLSLAVYGKVLAVASEAGRLGLAVRGVASSGLPGPSDSLIFSSFSA